jgi:hypothetical protein
MTRFMIALLLLVVYPFSAAAAIGQPFDPDETATLGYTAETTSPLSGGLTVYQMTRTLKNPVTGRDVAETLRQIAGPDGIVFALSWSGLHHPDLSRLLSGRLPKFLPFRRGARMVSSPNLVLHMAGTVIHSEGEAWDPSLVPPGISPMAVLARP